MLADVRVGTLFDNDVLIKLSAYDLGPVAGDATPLPYGALQTARYVVPGRLDRMGISRGRFDRIRADLNFVEPTEPELTLATRIQDVAIMRNVPVDGGESLLAAITLEREINSLVTGDKRAIYGLAALAEDVVELAALRTRIVCLEQFVRSMLSLIGPDELRQRICSQPLADRALTISFACHSGNTTEQDIRDGLGVYVRDIEVNAPGWLHGRP